MPDPLPDTTSHSRPTPLIPSHSLFPSSPHGLTPLPVPLPTFLTTMVVARSPRPLWSCPAAWSPWLPRLCPARIVLPSDPSARKEDQSRQPAGAAGDLSHAAPGSHRWLKLRQQLLLPLQLQLFMDTLQLQSLVYRNWYSIWQPQPPPFASLR
jgi:hypothetical protein